MSGGGGREVNPPGYPISPFSYGGVDQLGSSIAAIPGKSKNWTYEWRGIGTPSCHRAG
jgi:hypothetical protein